LDRLDEAHQTLLNETKNLIDFVCQSLTLYANDQTQNIEAIAGLPEWLLHSTGHVQ
ncbi:hypothetical protein IAF17_18825, partial [Acinetobacter baumannii]|nr:hypothetical protein [Acinetobacter baumannii]